MMFTVLMAFAIVLTLLSAFISPIWAPWNRRVHLGWVGIAIALLAVLLNSAHI